MGDFSQPLTAKQVAAAVVKNLIHSSLLASCFTVSPMVLNDEICRAVQCCAVRSVLTTSTNRRNSSPPQQYQ